MQNVAAHLPQLLLLLVGSWQSRSSTKGFCIGYKHYCASTMDYIVRILLTVVIVLIFMWFWNFLFFFRYNIPELAKKYKVYALDLLGFGWSEKAIIDYDALIWRDQVVDFMKEVVKEPAILVGNRSE